MSKTYKDLIFTTHAYERMQQRSISASAVYEVIHQAKKVYPSDQGSKKYIQTISGRTHHVVAKYATDQQKYLVISVWVRGENDPIPLAWQAITLPFRAVWWLLQKLW